jgi:hypothetical protein
MVFPAESLGNLRNIEDTVNGLWDWSIFNNCFPGTDIRMGDIDGIVERNGKFLIIEGKKPDTSIKLGQEILLKELSKNKNFTVYVIVGIPNKGEIHSGQRIIDGEYQKITIHSTEDMQKEVLRWFNWANNSIF